MSFVSKVLFTFFVFGNSISLGQDEVFDLQDATMIPHFLSNPMVLGELDLTLEQESTYKDVMRDLRQELATYASRAGGAQINDPALFDQLKKEYSKNLIQVSELFTQQLLPHQKKRLGQVFYRFKVRRSKAGDRFFPESLAIINDDIPGIRLTGKQKSDVKEKITSQRSEWIELLERHRQEIRELAKKHEEQLLESLTDEQRRSYQEVLGPALSFSEGVVPKKPTGRKK